MDRMEHKIGDKAEQEIVFFKNNDECPTCEQHIDEKILKSTGYRESVQ